jgi:uncharacterized protein YndB with AHSA1/START domain
MASKYEINVVQQINAPLGKVWGIISDFKNFDAWNPFMAMDPATKVTLGPTTTGEGASYSWESKKMGKGSMVFSGVYPENLITIDMTFMAPNSDTAKLEWRLTHVNDGVEMAWTMTGERKLFMVIMVAVLKMDKMMSKHFAAGLKRLKALAEA